MAEAKRPQPSSSPIGCIVEHGRPGKRDYGDIYGLIMLSHSNLPNISVELKTMLEKHEVGPNAVRFRNILLKFSDFDGGTDEMMRRLGT